MAQRLVDASQRQPYPDRSVKHTAHAVKAKWLSLGLDQWCPVSFRMVDRSGRPVDPDTVCVDVDRTPYDADGAQATERVVDSSTEVSWDDDSSARFLISADLLGEPCDLDVTWRWNQGGPDGPERLWTFRYAARTFMPDYAALSDDERRLCESTLNRFSMLRDNHYGNSMPNLAEDVQTEWSLEDVADEMALAVMRINGSVVQPTNYVVGSQAGMPFPKQFYNLLMVSTMVGIVRKLVYGYLETPDIAGSTNVAYADRRAYYNKWRDELRDLQADEQTLLNTFNRAHIDFTGSSVLVGGGLFGSAAGGSLMTNAQLAAVSKGWNANWYNIVPVTGFNPNGR